MINSQAKLYCLSPSTVAFQAESTEQGLKKICNGRASRLYFGRLSLLSEVIPYEFLVRYIKEPLSVNSSSSAQHWP